MSQKKTKNSVSFEALSSLDAPVSFWKGIPFGLQHVMAMFVANLAPIFIVANAAKMTSAQSAAVIQSGLLVAGLGTCLQLYGAWLIGSRLPMVTGISFTYVAAAAAICADKGYGAVVGAVIVGGLLELVLGLTARYWRRFVPPIVSAIVVTSIGFSLLTVGATSFGGGDASAADFGSWQNLTLVECDTRDRVRDIVFQVMGEQAARRLQKRSQHDQRNTPRNGGVFFAYCCRKAQKIDCNLCRVVVSFFYCPLKGCHRKALNRERGEPWKSGTACPRPSAW